MLLCAYSKVPLYRTVLEPHKMFEIAGLFEQKVSASRMFEVASIKKLYFLSYISCDNWIKSIINNNAKRILWGAVSRTKVKEAKNQRIHKNDNVNLFFLQDVAYMFSYFFLVIEFSNSFSRSCVWSHIFTK